MFLFFVPDTEIDDKDDLNLSFIRFHIYVNISSFYLHKQILSDHSKTYPSCMNIENIDRVKVTTP